MGEGHFHRTEHYSAIKRSEVLIHARIWMNFENTRQSEETRYKGHILQNFILMKCPEQVHPQNRKQINAYQGLGEGGNEE